MRPRITRRLPQKDLSLTYQKQRRKLHQLQEHALEEATRVAQVLVETFGVEKVYLIGPLSYDRYQEGMPLELALEGIPEGIYAKALAELLQDSSYELALIDLQQADSWTTRSIRERGHVLASQ